MKENGENCEMRVNWWEINWWETLKVHVKGGKRTEGGDLPSKLYCYIVAEKVVANFV